jgi:hypothetical protein
MLSAAGPRASGMMNHASKPPCVAKRLRINVTRAQLGPPSTHVTSRDYASLNGKRRAPRNSTGVHEPP